ncbi:MAG: hypothetical protein ACKOB4_04760, partial [Acidobacteriota bacterium]
DLFALPLSAPTLTEARVDESGGLLVSGGGFLPGADILINGERVRDTQPSAGAESMRLTSPEFWKVPAAPGAAVEVTVINPDGVRTSAVSLTRPGQARAVAAVSAASYNAEALAPEAIAAAFGVGLATTTEIARTQPLPNELAGTRVRVNGLLAPLFFVSPGQVNFLVPAAVQSGRGVIEILAGDQILSRGEISIGSSVASLFTANATGSGAPAALTTRDGLSYAAVGNPDGTSNQVSPGDYLILFGTGFRKASPGQVSIRIGGQEAPVLYAGPQGGYAGLDQINTRIPEGVTGAVNVDVTIGMKTANRVTLQIR